MATVKIPSLRFDAKGINTDVPIEEAISLYAGIDIRGKHGNIRCPLPEHDDKEPSAHIYKDSNKCRCFSCNTTSSVIDIAQAYNPSYSFPDLCKKICEDFGLPLEHYSNIEEVRAAKAAAFGNEWVDLFPISLKEAKFLGMGEGEILGYTDNMDIGYLKQVADGYREIESGLVRRQQALYRAGELSEEDKRLEQALDTAIDAYSDKISDCEKRIKELPPKMKMTSLPEFWKSSQSERVWVEGIILDWCARKLDSIEQRRDSINAQGSELYREMGDEQVREAGRLTAMWNNYIKNHPDMSAEHKASLDLKSKDFSFMAMESHCNSDANCPDSIKALCSGENHVLLKRFRDLHLLTKEMYECDKDVESVKVIKRNIKENQTERLKHNKEMSDAVKDYLTTMCPRLDAFYETMRNWYFNEPEGSDKNNFAVRLNEGLLFEDFTKGKSALQRHGYHGGEVSDLHLAYEISYEISSHLNQALEGMLSPYKGVKTIFKDTNEEMGAAMAVVASGFAEFDRAMECIDQEIERSERAYREVKGRASEQQLDRIASAIETMYTFKEAVTEIMEKQGLTKESFEKMRWFKPQQKAVAASNTNHDIKET